MKRTVAYIALGSNMGDKAQILRKALDLLRRHDGITLRRVSALMETAPLGGPIDQPHYLNGAVEIETTLEPEELLTALHETEAALGRNREFEERWGPRTCDLDLLMMEDIILESEYLTIPHPRMHLRRFVLEPLAQIAPEARHPVLFKTVAEILAELD